MGFLEELTAGFDVGYEICVLANHCAWKNADSLVKDLLEAIAQNRYHFFILHVCCFCCAFRSLLI